MQQFAVPQFIDAEDKIMGPITTRQFALMLVSGLICFILYKIFTFLFFVLASVLNLGIFAILAFVRINGRPIHYFLLNFLQTTKRPNLRVWNKAAYVRDVSYSESEIVEKKPSFVAKEPFTGSRLNDLTLIVNTGGVYETDDIIPPTQ